MTTKRTFRFRRESVGRGKGSSLCSCLLFSLSSLACPVQRELPDFHTSSEHTDESSGFQSGAICFHDAIDQSGYRLVVETLQANSNGRRAGCLSQRNHLVKSVIVSDDNVAMFPAPAENLVIRSFGQPGGRRMDYGPTTLAQKSLGSRRKSLIEEKLDQASASSSVRSSTAAAA